MVEAQAPIGEPSVFQGLADVAHRRTGQLQLARSPPLIVTIPLIGSRSIRAHEVS